MDENARKLQPVRSQTSSFYSNSPTSPGYVNSYQNSDPRFSEKSQTRSYSYHRNEPTNDVFRPPPNSHTSVGFNYSPNNRADDYSYRGDSFSSQDYQSYRPSGRPPTDGFRITKLPPYSATVRSSFAREQDCSDNLMYGPSGYQETDILDDASDIQDVYQPGTAAGIQQSSSEEDVEVEPDDPLFLEIQEREGIINKYSGGPDQDQIDDWENPEMDLFKKMDRFGFIHKEGTSLEEEERAHKKRLAVEKRRVKKWKLMEDEWRDKNVRPKKLPERVWKGIPVNWKITIWPRLLNINAYQKEGVYQQLLLRARLVSKDIKQIDLDINRTYRDHDAFRRRYDVKQRSLLNVLAAYSMYNTEVGYCQGMSQLAALFLMFMDEEEAFWCMHSLMVNERYMMHGFFVPGFPKLTRFEAHFKKVLKKFHSRIYKHLEKQDIPYIYLTKWWFGCFLDRVPFSLALRLWDVYLLEGESILIAMALNIMKMHEKTIKKLQIDNFMEFIQIKLANDFGFPDDETLSSLHETLNKLKNAGQHVPLPPTGQDGELSERPLKAFGPILAKPLSSIREEISEIQSRHSLAQSCGRSPHPRRKKSKPSLCGRSPQSHNESAPPSLNRIPLPHKDVPFEIPSRNQTPNSPTTRSTTPPQSRQYSSPSKIPPNNGNSPSYFSDRQLGGRTASIRDERTGHNVTIVRADDEDSPDSVPSMPSMNAKVVQGANNVTYISVGDDSDPTHYR